MAATDGGISFNLQQDLFVSWDRTGFAVYQTDPFRETVRRSIAGGVILVELLGRTNILAVVTTRRPHCVQFWDDTLTAFKFDLDFGTESIKAIRMRRDLVVIVLTKQVRLYKFSNELSFMQSFETIENTYGLVTISSGVNCIVSFPARRPGFLQIVHVDTLDQAPSPQGTKRPSKPAKIVIVSTHNNDLRCITMDKDGTRIATASTSGTLVRLWDTSHGRQIAELRRGIDTATIQSMSFSPVGGTDETRLAVISDKSTIHIFHLSRELDATQMNRKSSFAALASLGVPYFGSRWSVAQAHVEEPPLFKPKIEPLNRQFLTAWVNHNLFVVLSSDGSLWKYSVGKNKQLPDTLACHQEAYRQWRIVA